MLDGQIRNPTVHGLAQDWWQCGVSQGLDEKNWYIDCWGGGKLFCIAEVDVGEPVPVQGAVDAVSRVLIHVEFKILVI